jgi:hypothetical protein
MLKYAIKPQILKNEKRGFANFTHVNESQYMSIHVNTRQFSTFAGLDNAIGAAKVSPTFKL